MYPDLIFVYGHLKSEVGEIYKINDGINYWKWSECREEDMR